MKLLALGRKYFAITTRLTDHERFVEVAAKNDVDGLGRLVKVAIKNRKGVKEITRRTELAYQGLYHVKSFSVCSLCWFLFRCD